MPSEKQERKSYSNINNQDNYNFSGGSRRQNNFAPATIEKKQDISHISHNDNQAKSFGDEFNFSRDDETHKPVSYSRRDANRPVTGQNRRGESQDRKSNENNNNRFSSRGEDFSDNNNFNQHSRRRVQTGTVGGSTKPPIISSKARDFDDLDDI